MPDIVLTMAYYAIVVGIIFVGSANISYQPLPFSE
jgi:hypothetical protein